VPFAVGQIDRTKGFVHVLDGVSLDIVMRELDTVTEFIGYLSSKEELIVNGQLESAASEADLLADYLFPLEGKLKSSFAVPSNGSRLVVADDRWKQFDRDPFRLRKRNDDRISYLWDQLIERTSESIVSGKAVFPTPAPDINYGEKVLRLLAREPRWRRRQLATSIYDLVDSTKNLPHDRFTRLEISVNPDDTVFAFLLLARDRPWGTEDDYRARRREWLNALCEVTKLHAPHAMDIVGIATEPAKKPYALRISFGETLGFFRSKITRQPRPSLLKRAYLPKRGSRNIPILSTQARPPRL
jgi:hypothetical protein